MIKRFKYKKWYKTILDSGIFDAKYYLFFYPDVRHADIDPLYHFIKYGANEGKNPNEYFDLQAYIDCNDDIKQLVNKKEKLIAIIHYILHGKKEIKNGSRFLYSNIHKYNEEEYLNENPDIADAINNGDFNTYEHYVKFGCKEIMNRSRFSYQVYKEDEIQRFKKDKLSKIINPEDINPKTLYSLEVPVFKKPIVSIIIPAYNQAQYTHNTIESIIKSLPKISYEIIVMDDNSSQVEAKQLNKKIENIIFVSNKENLGFLKNCNEGSRYAKGKYLLFLNNDTYVLSNWLDSLVELIEFDKYNGMVGSKLVYPDGRLQEGGGIIWKDASGWNYGRLDIPDKSEYNYVKEVDYISGASIMIKKNLWNKIGGFDKRYTPAYYEDTDLAFEVRKYGFKVLYQPKSVLVHFEGISNGKDTGSGIKKYQVVNHEKFHAKWKDILEIENFNNAHNVFLAKNRSKNKKHILVIDHYVPEYDKDAGSRTMYQYLIEFVRLDYHVIFVPDNFNRLGHYGEMLESYGIEILYGVEFLNSGFENWLQVNSKYIDIVYLLRPHITIKYINLIKQYSAKSKIIYNGVDFHYLRLEREYELTKDIKTKLESEYYKEIEFDIFSTVDLVVTISDYEREIFHIEFPEKEIKVIPTYIYDKKFPLSKNSIYENRKNLLFVGGFSHQPNKDGLLWFMQYEWPQIKSKNTTIVLNIVGSNAPEDILALDEDPQVNILGFVSDEELNILYNTSRVIIAPLRYGAGVKGKVIEAIAQGVPVVTTDIASEGIINKNNIVKNVTNNNSFADAIIKLYNEKEEWYKFRSQQIKYAEKYFSQDAAKNTIKKVFDIKGVNSDTNNR